MSSPQQIQRLQGGGADLFLELPSGPRRHLFSIPEGGVVFHLPSVTVSPVPDATLQPLSFEEVPDAALEQWIEQLTASVAGDIPPKRYQALDPGMETAPDNRLVSPRSGIVWAVVLEGEAHYLGDEALPVLQRGDAIPLSPKGWLSPAGSARFAGESTVDFPDAPAALARLHELALARLQATAQRDLAAEITRSQKRTQFDSTRMDQALRVLASPLRQTTGTEGTGTGDPLLAACRTVSEYLGISFIPVPEGTPDNTTDPVQAIAEVSRARCRSVLLAAGWWNHEHGPMVARREDGQAPVALLPNGKGYLCFDPATGSRTKVTPDFAQTLAPFAWTFFPPFPAAKLTAANVFRFGTRGMKRELWAVLFAGAGVALTAIAVPAATGYAFDTLIPGARRAEMFTLAAILLAATFCGFLFDLLRGYTLLRVEGRMDTTVQAAVWDRLLDLPPAFFRNYSAGDLASRGLGIQTIREALTGSVVTSLLSGIFSLSSFALLSFYNPSLAVVALGLTLVAFAAVATSGYLQTRQQRRAAEVRGKLSGLLLQLVGGINKIRVSAAESRAFSAWADRFADLKTLFVRARTITNRISVFSSVWSILCSLILFSVYAKSLTKPDPTAPPMSTGDFVGFIAAFTQLLQAVLGFASALIATVSIAPAWERARPILEAIPETREGRSQPGELRGDIEVRHVSFSYGEDTPPILNNVSLRIAPGEFAAIVGPSGSGKSTLFRLLLGFETASSGSVYYDHRDMSNLDCRAVRRQIGVVLQNGRIRAGSIFQNIVGSSKLNVDDAWEAARMAGFDVDVEAMPMGMQTVLGEGGSTLSGGQRQRLLIARALVRRPRIVFFDEATSALDNQTQAIVSRSLDNLRATRVVIAHRLSTIERADRIYVLEKGQLVEEGSFADLMARRGAFAELAKRQIV